MLRSSSGRFVGSRHETVKLGLRKERAGTTKGFCYNREEVRLSERKREDTSGTLSAWMVRKGGETEGNEAQKVEMARMRNENTSLGSRAPVIGCSRLERRLQE
jgi:hypothetical protein